MKAGDKSHCERCGQLIMFTGRYWEHQEKRMRHIATPRTLLDCPIIISDEIKAPTKIVFGDLSHLMPPKESR